MATSLSDEMIKKIEDTKKKRDQYNAKLQVLESKLNDKRKKEDTRKKILVGAFVLESLQNRDPVQLNSLDSLQEKMNGFLTRKGDRLLFNLMVKESIEESADA